MNKLIIPLMLMLLTTACDDKVKTMYYPDYVIQAKISCSKNSFMSNGSLTENNSLVYVFTSKNTGDKATLELGSDLGRSYDTTYFGVRYFANDMQVQFDTGYSTRSGTFITNWTVK